MAVEIFDEDRIKKLDNLKLVITVYPSQDDYISHWYFESNGEDSDEISLKEVYAILNSISDVEDSVEKFFDTLYNRHVKKDDEQNE